MNPEHRPACSGFALPLVLIVLALLTALSFGLTRLVAANADLLTISRHDWEEERRQRDTIEEVVFMLLVGSYDQQSIHHGGRQVRLDGAVTRLNGVDIRVQSWSGLYSMALLGDQRIDEVLAQLVDSVQAAKISAEIGDWMDTDDRQRFRGREAAGYARSRLSMRPRNAPLRSVEELPELPSVTPALYYGSDDSPGLRDLFLAGGEDNFDLGTAPEVLIGPVMGLSDNAAGELIEARNDGDWSKVRFLIDENRWVFNDHGPFYKGLGYRFEIMGDNNRVSRMQVELTPYAWESLYGFVDWQHPDIHHE